MILSSVILGETKLERVGLASAFLRGRLSERATIDWALRLGPGRHVERLAILKLLDNHQRQEANEPYRTAWRLIEESWSNALREKDPALAIHVVRRRIRDEDFSEPLVLEITSLVAPRLEVRPLAERPWFPSRRLRSPKSFHDLLSVELRSNSLGRDFDRHGLDLVLGEVSDISFLETLASALSSAVDQGLYAARRIYGRDEDRWPPAARPRRVHYVPATDGTAKRRRQGPRSLDPDAFNQGGLTPSVRLLSAVVRRIAALDAAAGKRFVGGWRLAASSIHNRLWAAAACNSQLVSPGAVSEFLAVVRDEAYWNWWRFPEISELRATRFGELDHDAQKAVAQRLRKGPPRSFWRTKAAPEDIGAARRNLAALELRRIQEAGGNLPIPAPEMVAPSVG